MGNKNSNPNLHSTLTQANFHPEVEVLEKSHHDPHYGEVKVVRDVKNANKYVLKEIVHHTSKNFDNDHAFFSKRVTVKHPNVIDIAGFNTLSQTNLCANHFKITLFIEHVDRNLKSDLDVRRTTNQAYSDNEILSIADDVISGLAYFQQQNISHGDIRPLNIFVKNGTCKLSDPSLSAERGFTALVKSITSGTKTLPSPLVLQQIGLHKFESAGNPFKNDVFSLGATLLSLSTLTNSEDFYDYKKGKLDEVLIEQRLQIVQRTRPSSILELIRDMLTLNETKRPDPLALQQRIHALRGGARLSVTTVAPVQTTNLVSNYVPVNTTTLEQVKKSYVASPTVTTVQSDDLEARIKAALERSQATFRAVNASSTTTTTAPVTNISASTYVPTSYNYTVPTTTTNVVPTTTTTVVPTTTTVAPTTILRRSGVGLATSGYTTTTTPNFVPVGTTALTTTTTTPNYVPIGTTTTSGLVGLTDLRRSGVGLSTSGVNLGTVSYVPSNTTYTNAGLTTTTTTIGGVNLRNSGGVGLTTNAGLTNTGLDYAGYVSGGYNTNPSSVSPSKVANDVVTSVLSNAASNVAANVTV